MFDEAFINIFGDTEVSIFSPDANGDYYYPTDGQIDYNYMSGKICDIINSVSQNSDDYELLYGGEVTDGGSGTVDIAEAIAMTTDSDGNRRLAYFPGLTGVSLPSGWNDDRQIWVKFVHDFELGTETRTHRKTGVGYGSYHYQLEDSYEGSSSTDDLFDDSDPTGTAVILGSFSMNGTTFTDLNRQEIVKSKDIIIKNKFQVDWVSCRKIGTDLNISGSGNPAICALSDTDVVLFDDTHDTIQRYTFNGDTWTTVGSSFSISNATFPALCTLDTISNIDIVYIDSYNDLLQVYRYSGGSWSLIGGSSVSGSDAASMCALNSTDIAFVDLANDELRLYRFNGSTWSLVGSALSLSSATHHTGMAALNSTDIVLMDGGLETLSCYRFDFDTETWSLVGSSLSLTLVQAPAIAALNKTDVAVVGETGFVSTIYRFDGSTWNKIGSSSVVNTGGKTAICSLNGTDIAYFDGTQDDLCVFRFDYSPMGRPYRPF